MWHLRLSRRIPRCAPHLRREICGSPPSLGPVTQTEEDKQSPSPSPAQGQSALFAALPGVATAAGVMQCSFTAADHLGVAMLSAQGLDAAAAAAAASPISGVPVAIVAGLALSNAAIGPLALRERLKPGLDLCKGPVMQAGIVSIGLKLSLVDVASLGVAGLPIVAGCVGVGLGFVRWLNARLGLPPRLGALIAAGTSICGVTAITALAPAIRATEREVSFAVANVVAFGLIGMLAYPYLAHAVFAHSEQVGVFLGTAIHDTAQVMGAAATYAQMYDDEVVLKVAALTKLSRNLLLAGVIPALAVVSARDVAAAEARPATSSGSQQQTPAYDDTAGPELHSDAPSRAQAQSLPAPDSLWRSLVKHTPTFLYGFVGAVALRSAGDAGVGADGLGQALGLIEPDAWASIISTVPSFGAHYLLGTAMASVGLSTSFRVFKGVGLKPFAVGMCGAAVVGTAGFTAATFLGSSLSV